MTTSRCCTTSSLDRQVPEGYGKAMRKRLLLMISCGRRRREVLRDRPVQAFHAAGLLAPRVARERPEQVCEAGQRRPAHLHRGDPRRGQRRAAGAAGGVGRPQPPRPELPLSAGKGASPLRNPHTMPRCIVCCTGTLTTYWLLFPHDRRSSTRRCSRAGATRAACWRRARTTAGRGRCSRCPRTWCSSS